METSKNAIGTPLNPCSLDPMTGWYRDGCCNTDENDRGSHTVCAQVTQEFLEFLQSQGNDLITPAPHFNFPGLKPGDRWCVCAASWLQAYHQGVACPVNLLSTHARALDIVPLDFLMEYSIAIND